MKTSTDPILTTHVGSLPRQPDVLAQVMALEVGESAQRSGGIRPRPRFPPSCAASR